MPRKLAVGDVMTHNFISVSPTVSVLECIKKMVKHRVGNLLLMHNNKLVGMVTRRDILEAIAKKPSLDLKTLKASEVATKKLAVIKPSAHVAQAFQKMKYYSFTRLPVVANEELVGIITLKDILKVDPTYYAYTGELLDVREESRKLTSLESTAESEGFCDNCGAFADLLPVEKRALCIDCRDELY